LAGLWALEWAWHTDETILRCAQISRIYMPYPRIAAFIVSEITAFIQSNRVNLFATFSFKCLALDRILKVHNLSEFFTTGEGKE